MLFALQHSPPLGMESASFEVKGSHVSTVALWFELDDSSADAFSRSIDQLARHFDAPSFVPHITIFGGLWFDSAAAFDLVGALVSGGFSADVTFGVVSFDDVWSRSIYLRAQPSPEMLELHDRATKMLGVSGPQYAPYLNLLYGEFSKGAKVQAVDEIELQLPDSAALKSVSLWHTDPAGVNRWKRLTSVELTTSAPTIT